MSTTKPLTTAATTANAANAASNAAAATSKKCVDNVLDEQSKDEIIAHLMAQLAAKSSGDSTPDVQNTILEIDHKNPAVLKVIEEKKVTQPLSWADSASISVKATEATDGEWVSPPKSPPKERIMLRVQSPNGTTRLIDVRELVMIPADGVSVWLRAITAVREARGDLTDNGAKVNSTVEEVIVSLGTNFKRPEEGVMMILRMERDAAKAFLQFCPDRGFRPVSTDCLCPVDADGEEVPYISVKNPKSSATTGKSSSSRPSSHHTKSPSCNYISPEDVKKYVDATAVGKKREANGPCTYAKHQFSPNGAENNFFLCFFQNGKKYCASVQDIRRWFSDQSD